MKQTKTCEDRMPKAWPWAAFSRRRLCLGIGSALFRSWKMEWNGVAKLKLRSLVTKPQTEIDRRTEGESKGERQTGRG